MTMEAWKNGRTLQPRPQQGTTLLASMQLLATDEGVFLARVAFRDPATGRTLVAHSTKAMWDGGIADVEHFAAGIAGAVQDVAEWVVS